MQAASGNIRRAASLILIVQDKLTKIDKSRMDYKVLMFNRHENASFMPNSAVFPGGVWEPADSCSQWQQYFQSNYLKANPTIDSELALRITAIRETFEEIGVLLCRDCRQDVEEPSNRLASGYGSFKEDFDRQHWQNLVHNDPSKFLELCQKLHVIPDVYNLHKWSNWLSPATMTKRFDTIFYLSALEHIPDLLIETGEVKDCSWKSPRDYLQDFSNKQCLLPPPQFYELSRFLNFHRFEELKNFAQERNQRNMKMITITPVLYNCTDGHVSLLPCDDSYPTDPNSYSNIIETNQSMAEFRQNVEQLHRLEFHGTHDVCVRINLKTFDNHINPKQLNTKSSTL